MKAIQYSTIHRRALSWYDRPIVITIKKSTLIILILLGYILWSQLHTKVVVKDAILKPVPTSTPSPKPPELLTVSHQDIGGFSSPAKVIVDKVQELQKQEDDKKAQESARVVEEAQAQQQAVIEAEAVKTAPEPVKNEYPMYQCTWFVKEMRPDVPNNLGDAMYWFTELASRGWVTSYIPRAGAIGQSILGNHVIYVMYVNSDGTIHLAERNYDYNGSYRERDAPAEEFEYIY